MSPYPDPNQPPEQYPQGQPTTPTPAPRTWLRRLLWPAVSVAALVIGIAIGAASASTPTTATAAATPAPTVTVTVAPEFPVTTAAPSPAAVIKPTPTPKPKPVKATIQDGYSVVVGSDVPAGKYEAHSTSGECYWEIDKHATSDIVDNDLGKQGHLVVTLKRGEDFSSSDCGDWTQQ